MKQILSVENVSQLFDYRRSRSIQDRFTRAEFKAESFLALDSVSFSLDQGESLALLGPNGSGKSTLLKVVGGIFRPTSGLVRRKGRLGALLELGAGFHPELTGRENIFLNSAILGLSKKETQLIFDRIVDFSGISRFIDSPVKTYSSGMYVRLGFAIAVHTEPDLLLVDEVLAVGDEQFQAQCLERIRQLQAEGRSIVLVTHSMSTAVDFTDRAVLLDHGKLRYQGNTQNAANEYHKLLSIPIASNQNEADQPKVYISSLDVKNCREGEVFELKRGNEIEFKIELLEFGKVNDWSILLEIWTSSGDRILRTTRSKSQLHLQNSQVPKYLRFNIRDLHLSNGKYRIAVHTINEQTGERWSDWIDQINFEVLDSLSTVGPIEASLETSSGS